MQDSPYHRAVTTGLRLARDRLEPLDALFTDKEAEYGSYGRSASHGYYGDIRGMCVTALRDAAGVLIGHLVACKADRANNRRNELTAAIGELSSDLTTLFDRHDCTPLFPKPVAERTQLVHALDVAAEKLMLDFDEGVFHMSSQRDPTIVIGSIGQMAGHIGSGNSGAVRAEQTMNQASVLTDLASAVRVGVQDETDRATLLAAIDAMSHAQRDKAGLGRSYATFISRAADYMSLVSPFLPALVQLVSAAGGPKGSAIARDY